MCVGDRVRLHPASDWWMRGATHGRVHLVGRAWVWISLEVGGREIGKIVRFRRGSDLFETVI